MKIDWAVLARTALTESPSASSPAGGRMAVEQVGMLLALILRDLPIQSTFRRRAAEMLAQMASTPAEFPSLPPVYASSGEEAERKSVSGYTIPSPPR